MITPRWRYWQVSGTALLLGIVLLVVGCTALPPQPENMTPKQLSEWAKDKSNGITCLPTPWGTMVIVSNDLVTSGAGAKNSRTLDLMDGCKTIKITETAPVPVKP